MKTPSMFVLIIILLLTFCGCKETQVPLTAGQAGDIYFSIDGYASAVSGDYLVIESTEGDLKIINLPNKEVIKTIPLPNKYTLGFDIFEDKVVWSDLRNESDSSKIKDYFETANADVFLYDINTDKIIQITQNASPQISPRIWKNYIVWQDNKNDSKTDMYPEWDIYLYNIDTKEEKLITTQPGIHTNPSINDFRIVWEDGRSCNSDISLRWGTNVPENNTDVYLYDIRTGAETAISNGMYRESNPVICGKYVIWEDRNQGLLEADIVMCEIENKQKVWITKDEFNQGSPQIFDHFVVWTDERRGISTNDVFVNGKAPNSDIFLYDINTGMEQLLTEDEPQIMPSISSNWVSYITSRQVNPIVQVVKYR